MLYSLIAVGIGAASGAWLRWGLGIWLNPIFPTVPLGTLASNLIGGYIMGLAMGFFSHYQAVVSGGSAADHHRIPRRAHHFFHVFC